MMTSSAPVHRSCRSARQRSLTGFTSGSPGCRGRGSLTMAAGLLIALLSSPSFGKPPLMLSVDASHVTARTVHVHLQIPTQPGELHFAYPKWIPGDHAPTGPI